MEFGSGALSPFTLAEMIEQAPYDDIWHPHDAAWDGETIGAFWTRTGEAAEAIWRAGGTPLVVSHAGTTQGILRWTMRIAPDAPDSFSLFVGNASLTEVVVRVDRHGRRRAEPDAARQLPGEDEGGDDQAESDQSQHPREDEIGRAHV